MRELSGSSLVYRRLGDRDKARKHVALGKQTLAALNDDGYKQTIRDAVERVERQLA